MLSRLVIAYIMLNLGAAHLGAADRDYLQRGEKELTADYEIKYDRAVRHVLSLAWRRDVVLRSVDLPPFQPEWAVGIRRDTPGYRAFSVTASRQIWDALGFGSTDPKKKRGDYRGVAPKIFERSLSQSLAARISALWRRVLADPRNYGKDNGIYLDTDQFTYYVAFRPREHLTAYVVGWGPRTEQLILVADALASYAAGDTEAQLVRAVSKAERKLGI
jgi:hypothetical protein